jgi:hypothetical protein
VDAGSAGLSTICTCGREVQVPDPNRPQSPTPSLPDVPSVLEHQKFVDPPPDQGRMTEIIAPTPVTISQGTGKGRRRGTRVMAGVTDEAIVIQET